MWYWTNDVSSWWQRFRAPPGLAAPATADEPLRAELFSADQLTAHGRCMAAAHVLEHKRVPDHLLARLTANERVLADLAKRLTADVADPNRLSPAAEWLLDNYYLIKEEILTARRHLPRGYSRELPRLAPVAGAGHAAGVPRVYDLALQLVAHGDGHVERSTLSRFIAAYQSVHPLLLGELWAIPIMLRLALIENLRRVAARVTLAHAQRATAGTWAAKMVAVAEATPSDLILVVADMARSEPPLTSAFVAEFARALQGRGTALALPLTWMEQRLADSGVTIEQMVRIEGQQQAANQVSVSNSIGSLRLIATIDWREFVETLSSVEQTLRSDPSGVYAQMDFSTRDRYRHVVESLARVAPRTESAIARIAVELAAAAPVVAGDTRRTHVGYYLLDAGRIALERAVGARTRASVRWGRALRTWALPLYGGAIVLGSMAFSVIPLLRLHAQLAWPWWAEAAIALLLLLAASQLSVALVNWLVTLWVAPQPLPRRDFSFGIAPESRTLVVVPTMLGSVTGIEALVEALEVRYLANRDPNLHFGLLTDLHDAGAEHLPTDAALIDLAATRIAALNAKYARPAEPDGRTAFYLFHRPRRWNARERVWMGYERKRGKLADLNALLRGRATVGPNGCFARIVGEPLWLSAVRYVITLDTDTQLPRGAAAQMVAAMAHPLNRPRFGNGESAGIVVEGYGILQPRLAPSLPSTNRSGYARLHGGEAGIDPYTRAVSDVYQDLFGEGSFIGKGIYDVDAFERALAGRLPENRILSHDLLEGAYARCGLLSDVELIEDAPATHASDVARRYRWIRGDWQLLDWLLPFLPSLPGSPRNPLSPLSRAKILDNLRRSLVPPALLLLLLTAWALLPEPGLWTVYGIVIVALVPVASTLTAWLRRPLQALRSGEPSSAHAPLRQQAQRLLVQILQSLACLPFEAAYSVAAVSRTLWRVLWSGRRMLEWLRGSRRFAIQTNRGQLWPIEAGK